VNLTCGKPNAINLPFGDGLYHWFVAFFSGRFFLDDLYLGLPQLISPSQQIKKVVPLVLEAALMAAARATGIGLDLAGKSKWC